MLTQPRARSANPPRQSLYRQTEGRVQNVSPVPRKDLVSPLARENHPRICCPGGLADEQGVDRGRISKGLVHVVDNLRVDRHDVGRDSDPMHIEPKVLAEGDCIGLVVVLRVVAKVVLGSLDREAAAGNLRILPGAGHDRRGIYSSRQ